jgi:hypothetical protein
MVNCAIQDGRANETVTWNRKAHGQSFTCSNGTTWNWPDNNDWSQDQHMGDPCSEGGSLVTQPSNWSTTNYPNGPQYDVILGGDGGASARLDVDVTLNSLTILSNGGLVLQFGKTITTRALEFKGDIGVDGYCARVMIPYGGNITKSAGHGASTIFESLGVDAFDSTITVASGSLMLPAFSSVYSNCMFNISTGAALVMVPPGTSATLAGRSTGSGMGNVLLNGGCLHGGDGGATLNLPGSMFQWTGGCIGGVTNAGNMIASGSVGIEYGTVFYNAGALRLLDGTRFCEHNQTGASGRYNLQNLPGGLIEFQGNSSWTEQDSPAGASAGALTNRGVLLKTGDTNSIINVSVCNLGGTVAVERGTLTMPWFQSCSSSNVRSIIQVSNDAMLDISGSPDFWQGGTIGTGGGTVCFHSGGLVGGPGGATLDFPDAMFQWTGGLMGNLTNAGVMTVSAGGGIYYNAVFYNAGALRLKEALFQQEYGSGFDNLPGGQIDFQGNVTWKGSSYSSLTNRGLFRVAGGTNSIIDLPLYNQGGSLCLENGMLAVPDFEQSGGSLMMTLGGHAPELCGRLNVRGMASLDGPLSIVLPATFTPAVGECFQILSCNERTGLFSSVNVPSGFAVNYASDGVFLVVTSSISPRIIGGTISNGIFSFSFSTTTNQSYTVQVNNDISTSDWRDYTNLIGDDCLKQIHLRADEYTNCYFRVRLP